MNIFFMLQSFRMTVSSELWQANQDPAHWNIPLQGIADGTLHRKKFTMWDKMPFPGPSPVHTALRQRKLLTVRDLVPSMPQLAGVRRNPSP